MTRATVEITMNRFVPLLVLVAACRGADDPRPLTGSLYVLQSIGGDALPAAITPVAVATPTVVYADTIALRPDGTGERRTLRNGPVEGTKVLDRSNLVWTRTGTAVDIRIVLECPFGADCFVPEYHGTEESGKITITTGAGIRVPLVYQYLYPPD
jgi:hypothetical protein